jgi:hypothetical protein
MKITLTLSIECFCILYLIIPSVIIPHKACISLWTSPFFLYPHILLNISSLLRQSNIPSPILMNNIKLKNY